MTRNIITPTVLSATSGYGLFSTQPCRSIDTLRYNSIGKALRRNKKSDYKSAQPFVDILAPQGLSFRNALPENYFSYSHTTLLFSQSRQAFFLDRDQNK